MVRNLQFVDHSLTTSIDKHVASSIHILNCTEASCLMFASILYSIN